MIYGLRSVCKVVGLHAFHINVLKGLGVRLKRISYYTLRLVLNRIIHINLLVLDFFESTLVVLFHFG